MRDSFNMGWGNLILGLGLGGAYCYLREILTTKPKFPQ